MATERSQKLNVERISQLRESIENQLQGSLNEEGTVDLIKLRDSNKPLAEIFDIITLSKTWRDDPKAFAKDVARMISGRDTSSDLAAALKKLEGKLGPKKSTRK